MVLTETSSFAASSGAMACPLSICQSAEDAYDMMYSKVFDIIISDIMMQGTILLPNSGAL